MNEFPVSSLRRVSAVSRRSVSVVRPRRSARGEDASRAFSPEQSIGTALRETYRSFARTLTPRLQASGVTLAMWFALRELWKRDGLSQAGLARALDSHPSAIVAVVGALRRAGLADVRRSAADRRIIEVRLTSRGRAARARLAPHGIDVNETALAGFSPGEVKSLLAMLARLRRNLEQTT